MEDMGAEGLLGSSKVDASELLGVAGRVSQGARRARHGYWFAFLLFGLIILGSLPLYRPLPPQAGGREFTGGGAFAGLDLGGIFNDHAWGIAMFWLIAIPLGYIATATYYRLRARRTGVQSRIWPYVVTGVVLFALLVLTGPGITRVVHIPSWLLQWRGHIPDLFIRGLTPLLVIAVGFFVLAWLERSWAVLVIAATFLAIALLANLYNISNAFQRINWTVPDWVANIAVAGGFLVFVGLISGLVAWRRPA